MNIYANKNRLFSILCFSLVMAVISVHSQGRGNTITGFVYDSQRNPVREIPVELMDEVNSVLQRVKTDSSGRYYFSGLSMGRFNIKVLPYGTDFEEQTQDIQVGTMLGGRMVPETAQKDFYLKLRKTTGNQITGTIFAQEVPEDAKKLYEEAINNLQNKQSDAGISKLQEAVKTFPTYYLALERLGREYIYANKYENAIEVFSKAVETNNRSYTSWFGLGYANSSLHKPLPAIEALQKALVIQPNSIDTLLLLGSLHREVKQFAEAEKSLTQAKKLDNKQNPDIYWNLALLYAYNLLNYSKAANELETFLEINKEYPNKDAIKKLIKQFRDKSKESK